MELLNKLFEQQQQAAQPQQQQQQQPQGSQVPAHQQSQQNQTQQTPNSQSGAGNTNQFNQSTVPDGKTPEQQKQPQSPLDEFGNLFDNEPQKDDQGNPIQQNSGPKEYVSMDPKKFGELVNNMDFLPSGESAKELMQKAQEGDSQALLQLMNHASRNTYQQQAQLTQQLINKVAQQLKDEWSKEIPEQVRGASVNSTIQSNPKFQHKAAQPVVRAIADQIRQKYPNATSQEVSQMTEQYFSKFAEVFSSGDQQDEASGNQRRGSDQEFNWADFFNPGQG